MNLTELLTPDCTVCAVPGTSKKTVLEHISKLASQKIRTSSEKELLNTLLNREKLSSTGIGNGIAIPHGRLDNADKVVAILLTTAKPVEFDAIDDKPVDIFVALFVPSQQCERHLETLASIAKRFSEKEFCRKIRRCQTSDQLYQTLIAC
ncbi:PTS IIA-like nitrogen regulatory protein PtsN [Thalassotalea aquiviva]|uniref:PTS IIA-like nitrogen regulatory protein PtsN n=1 Tax=Thalassotalea aquiviva TaxID=3242415 RepID=UPI003529D9ED